MKYNQYISSKSRFFSCLEYFKNFEGDYSKYVLKTPTLKYFKNHTCQKINASLVLVE